jgi:hypothetical protein
MKTTNKRMRRGFLAAWALLAGCSMINSFKFQEDSEKLCTNEKDDDGDGATDCSDSECKAFVPCLEKQHTDDEFPWNDNYCTDGVDNDGDELIDCLDVEKDEETGEVYPYSCSLLEACLENTFQKCGDLLDNDGDRSVDCEDPDCRSFCLENDPSLCSNWMDDDGDRLVDCEDDSCGETGSCPGDMFGWCMDGIDNDGDSSIDCEDPECQSTMPDCDPTSFHEVMTDNFDRTDMGAWNVYDYRTIREPLQEHVTEADGRALHVRVGVSAGVTPPSDLREETGVMSKQTFETWGNVTFLIFDMKVAPPVSAPPDVVVPAVAGIVLDSTDAKPFMDRADSSGTSEPVTGRHAVLALLVDWKGGVQLCARGPDDVAMKDCIPRDGAILPTTPPDPEGYFTYGLALTDQFIAVSLGVEPVLDEVLRVENLSDEGVPKYLPGIGRLFFVGSTDRVGPMYASEFWVNNVMLAQQYLRDDISTSLYNSVLSTPLTLDTANPDHCSNTDGDIIQSTWVSNANEYCTVNFAPGSIDLAQRLQMSYVTSATADDSAYFLPGLWNAALDFDLGMPLAAGFMGAESMNQLVFRPCVPALQEIATPGFVNAGYVVGVVAGHDPDRSFSYAVFQNADGTSDAASAVAYDSACYGLQKFGLTSRNCTVTECLPPTSAAGTVQSVEVRSYWGNTGDI